MKVERIGHPAVTGRHWLWQRFAVGYALHVLWGIWSLGGEIRWNRHCGEMVVELHLGPLFVMVWCEKPSLPGGGIGKMIGGAG
jgi:hypothetical protein